METDNGTESAMPYTNGSVNVFESVAVDLFQ